MANTKQIRSKIKSVKNLQKIIRALEIVSTIKLQKLKDKTNMFKTFVMDFLNILQSLKDKINLFDFDKTSRDPHGRRLLIVITSDKWLCGGINSKLLKHISGKYYDRKEKVDIIAIGKKGLEYFIRDKRNVVASIHLNDDINQNDLRNVFAYVKKSLSEKSYSKIKVYFNFFKNTVTQVPLRFKLYPLDEESFDMFLKDLGVNLSSIQFTSPNDLVIEPNIDQFKQLLTQELVEHIIYNAVINNKTWEHAARMLAMKNAKDNCGDILSNLNLFYNKTRQQKITQEISEIVSAKIAIEQH